MVRIRCGICQEKASRFFVTLDNSLWAVCEEHASPFEGLSIELDPDVYDVEAAFQDDDDDDCPNSV